MRWDKGQKKKNQVKSQDWENGNRGQRLLRARTLLTISRSLSCCTLTPATFAKWIWSGNKGRESEERRGNADKSRSCESGHSTLTLEKNESRVSFAASKSSAAHILCTFIDVKYVPLCTSGETEYKIKVISWDHETL